MVGGGARLFPKVLRGVDGRALDASMRDSVRFERGSRKSKRGRARRSALQNSNQSYASKGIMTTGHKLSCKDFLCFNTVPCRPTPLLVHFSDRTEPRPSEDWLQNGGQPPDALLATGDADIDSRRRDADGYRRVLGPH